MINCQENTTTPNIRYKTLGFRWLFEHYATQQVRCNWTEK